MAADDDREPEPAANPAGGEPGGGEPGGAQTGGAKPASPNRPSPRPTPEPGKQPGRRGSAARRCSRRMPNRPTTPKQCAGCGRLLAPAGAVAYTGFQAVDLRWDEPARPGLTLWGVDHRYYEISCPCGHRTRAVAGQGCGGPAAGGNRIERMAAGGTGAGGPDRGAGPAVPAVAGRIQEFLAEWLGLEAEASARSIRRSTKPAPQWPRWKTNWSGRSWRATCCHADENLLPEPGRRCGSGFVSPTTATWY